jgi:hypothetical protein
VEEKVGRRRGLYEALQYDMMIPVGWRTCTNRVHDTFEKAPPVTKMSLGGPELGKNSTILTLPRFEKFDISTSAINHSTPQSSLHIARHDAFNSP